jgi:hypothetical protein
MRARVRDARGPRGRENEGEGAATVVEAAATSARWQSGGSPWPLSGSGDS